MPKKYTRFCSKWYSKLDATENPCSYWLKQGKTISTFLCLVCNEEKSCKNGGWSDVFKHSQRPKHIQRFKNTIESNPSIELTPSLTFDDNVTRAEAYWAMATAKLALSYNSSQYIQELFAQMFSDSNIAREFSMKPRKLSYILSHGIGFYFTKTMLFDLAIAPGYSLLFDETITANIRKQLDLHFRYWCEKKQTIVVRYYKSIFIDHSSAENIFKHIIDALRADGIDITKMLMLGRDNPNINKSIEKLMDQEIRLERQKRSSAMIKSNLGLIHIGSCPLHLIHNSFKTGIDSTNWAVDESLNNLALWFRRSPSRRADYLKVSKMISNYEGKFIRRFVITRWLDAGPIIERVIEQYDNLKEYFLHFIPKSKPMSMNNHRYIEIKNLFEHNSTLSRFHYIVFLYNNVYKQILVWFQQTSPLIHILYDECEQFARRLILCFIKHDLIEKKSFNDILLNHKDNQKSDEELEIGEATRRSLINLTDEEIKVFFSDIRSVYLSIANEVKRTLPLSNDLLRNLQCLKPSMRHSNVSHQYIMNVARSFPQINMPDDIDRISAEWYLYQNENIPNEWFEKQDGYHAIDYYWKNIFTLKTNSGANKFIALAKLVKCALSLSHGNADVERGFSENAYLLTDDRTRLSDASVNGLRATRDGIKYFGDGKPHQVPITKELIDSIRDAHARYRIDSKQQESNEQRKTDEKKIRSNSQSKKEQSLCEEQQVLHKNLTNIQNMIVEGSERLAKAVLTRDFEEIKFAQILIETGSEKLCTTNTEIINNNNEIIQMRKKKKL